MPLELTSDFLIFSFIFVLLNLAFDAFSKRFLHSSGVDFLFFAPWLTGIRFGIYEGLLLAIILSVSHSFIYLRLQRFVLFSFPAQIIVVFSGHFFGFEGFWFTLIGYYFLTTVIVRFLGGIGARYFIFIFLNSITNIFLNYLFTSSLIL
ncbi:MAG: hypothetical protein HYW24_01745 [Candidatus Aenigmarchaeota archaeon]|nr:hypothetical protein [Candidatus Aenigmarchaeota archaeon]